MPDNTINIVADSFEGLIGDFESLAEQFFEPNSEYRGYDQLISLAKSHRYENHDLYRVSCEGALAGLAAVEMIDDTIRFNVFVVSPEFREVGVGDTLFEYVIHHEKYKNASAYESYALPGDRHTKNFFETRKGKARLLIVRGELA
jgi:GNAT superfamily N-acetyltransferase